MRRLIDPAGTLGVLAYKVSLEVLIILIVGLAAVALSFVVPARFAAPFLIAIFLPVNPCLSFGMKSLQLKGPKENRWLGVALLVLLGLLVAGAVACWVDYATHVLPDRLSFSGPAIARTPFFRDFIGTEVLVVIYCAAVLTGRARQVSFLRGSEPTSSASS